MLNIATEFSGESFVLASSSSVYGSQKKRIPFVENETSETPQSPYAFSKLFAEKISRDYSNISSLNVSSLRFFTVYGPAGRVDMSILKFIHNIINDYPINVFGNGFQERDFTYVKDICDGIIKSSQIDGFEIFNLGSSKPYSVIKVLSTLKEIINKEPKIEYLPSNSGILVVTKKNSVDEDLFLPLLTIAIDPLSKVLTKFTVSLGFFI